MNSEHLALRTCWDTAQNPYVAFSAGFLDVSSGTSIVYRISGIWGELYMNFMNPPLYSSCFLGYFSLMSSCCCSSELCLFDTALNCLSLTQYYSYTLFHCLFCCVFRQVKDSACSHALKLLVFLFWPEFVIVVRRIDNSIQATFPWLESETTRGSLKNLNVAPTSRLHQNFWVWNSRISIF